MVIIGSVAKNHIVEIITLKDTQISCQNLCICSIIPYIFLQELAQNELKYIGFMKTIVDIHNTLRNTT
jgi:hypothetical protein